MTANRLGNGAELSILPVRGPPGVGPTQLSAWGQGCLQRRWNHCAREWVTDINASDTGTDFDIVASAATPLNVAGTEVALTIG
jgi:hypothetical protein